MNKNNFSQAVLGLMVLGLGITLLVTSGGPDPWGVFLLSLNQYLPLTLGITSQIAGLFLVLLNYFWGKRRPGLGTIMSMVLVGVFMDLFMALFSWAEGISGLPQILMLLTGITLQALGISVYVRAGLGEGPIEGLMLVLSKKLNVSVGAAKVSQDVFFFVLGIILGGPLRWGTLVTVMAVGPTTQLFMKIIGKNQRNSQQV